MKKCPFCAEEIQEEAIKCRYCGEFIKEKWYFKTGGMIIAFLAVGPFALPLVWKNPRFNRKTKVIITVIITIITYVLCIIVMKSVQNIICYYNKVFQYM